MAIISVIAFSNTFKCLLQAENSMTGKACKGEVLTQVWLRNEQVNAQKEKNFQSSRKLMQAHEKCAMKMKQSSKNDVCIKMLLMEGNTYN